MQRLKVELHCPFDNHDQSLIVGVCVNEQCLDKRPFCVACQYQFHSSHKKDLKRFDDFKDLLCENSQLSEKLKSQLKDLQYLVKVITHLVEATQYLNNSQILLELNYTDLHNNINTLITQWNQQRNLCEFLQDTFSTNVKNKINTLKYQKQKISNDVPKLKTDVLKQEDLFYGLPVPKQLKDLTINSIKDSTSLEMVEDSKLKQISQKNFNNQKNSQPLKGYFNPNAIQAPRLKPRGYNNLEQHLNTTMQISRSEKYLENQRQEQIENLNSSSFAVSNLTELFQNASNMIQRSDKKSKNAIKIQQIS
ncbi:unnamed protein product [Paramecium octaurelia]|uniref:Uncharacterized protein n=1 Tax=Paramecium octaurelia TaxID=43137 RepID=A0A8S1W5Z4_PAROT|nr:unnamed protein product [Paramecium octaurelia]